MAEGKKTQTNVSTTSDFIKEKGPIKFNIQLNEEQKIAKQKILEHAITILSGKAGSGKTLVACNVALDMLFKKVIKKIIITRPTVSKEEIGFLPGDLRDKMEPWVQPIYSNFYQLYNKSKIDQIIESGQVEIVPLAFMRGRTFLDSFIIVDEAQNCTNEQMEMITTRLGLRSKMVVCGDTRQIDLKTRKMSGLDFLIDVGNDIDEMTTFELMTNHRHSVVDALLVAYEKLNLDKK